MQIYLAWLVADSKMKDLGKRERSTLGLPWYRYAGKKAPAT